MSTTDYKTFRSIAGRVAGERGSRSNYMTCGDGIRIMQLPRLELISDLEASLQFPRASPVVDTVTQATIGGAVEDISGLTMQLVSMLRQHPGISQTEIKRPDERIVSVLSIDGTGLPWAFVKGTVHVLNFTGVRFSVQGSVVAFVLNLEGSCSSFFIVGGKPIGVFLILTGFFHITQKTDRSCAATSRPSTERSPACWNRAATSLSRRST